MIQEIKTIDDIKVFFRQLLEEDLNFHPDTPFEDYINCETRLPTYTTLEADARNKLMDNCFEVCESINIDIYELSYDMFIRYTGLDKSFLALIYSEPLS